VVDGGNLRPSKRHLVDGCSKEISNSWQNVNNKLIDKRHNLMDLCNFHAFLIVVAFGFLSHYFVFLTLCQIMCY